MSASTWHQHAKLSASAGFSFWNGLFAASPILCRDVHVDVEHRHRLPMLLMLMLRAAINIGSMRSTGRSVNLSVDLRGGTAAGATRFSSPGSAGRRRRWIGWRSGRKRGWRKRREAVLLPGGKLE
jgi:hypothetical protein